MSSVRAGAPVVEDLVSVRGVTRDGCEDLIMMPKHCIPGYVTTGPGKLSRGALLRALDTGAAQHLSEKPIGMIGRMAFAYGACVEASWP